MGELTIEVQRREELGKNASRRLRQGGLIPAVVYGGGKDTVPIQVDRKIVLELLKSGSGENAIFLLKLAGTGKGRHTMIRDLQVDPVSREIVHIDFQRIVMTEKVRVDVPIEIAGTAPGVKNEGGLLDFVTREVEVECLPGDIPQRIAADVSELHIGQHLEVKDLVLPPEVAILEDLDRVVVSIAHPRLVEEVAEEEAVEELLEAEAEEPELIRRGKVAEEEEGEEGEEAEG